MSVRKILLLVRGSTFDRHPRNVATRFDDSEELHFFEYYPDVDEVFDLDSEGNFLFRTFLRLPLGTMIVDAHGTKVDPAEVADVMQRMDSNILSLEEGVDIPDAPWMGDLAFSTAEVWRDGDEPSKYWIQEIADEGIWTNLLELFRRGISGFPNVPRTLSGDDDGTFAFGVDGRYREILASNAEKAL